MTRLRSCPYDSFTGAPPIQTNRRSAVGSSRTGVSSSTRVTQLRGTFGRGTGWSNHCRTSGAGREDRKSTRLNSSHGYISYAVFCLKKKKKKEKYTIYNEE